MGLAGRDQIESSLRAGTPGSPALFMLRLACLALAALAAVLFMENRGLKSALASIDNGYLELMAIKKDGRALAEYVLPGSVGIFGMSGRVIACAELTSVPFPGSKPDAPAASSPAAGTCQGASPSPK
jgi:hypothetical protein